MTYVIIDGISFENFSMKVVEFQLRLWRFESRLLEEQGIQTWMFQLFEDADFVLVLHVHGVQPHVFLKQIENKQPICSNQFSMCFEQIVIAIFEKKVWWLTSSLMASLWELCNEGCGVLVLWRFVTFAGRTRDTNLEVSAVWGCQMRLVFFACPRSFNLTFLKQIENKQPICTNQFSMCLSRRQF